jgi:hypothetical protein
VPGHQVVRDELGMGVIEGLRCLAIVVIVQHRPVIEMIFEMDK